MLDACHGLLDPDNNGKVVDDSPDGGPTLLAMAAMDLLPKAAAILLEAGASPNMLTTCMWAVVWLIAAHLHTHPCRDFRPYPVIVYGMEK